MTSLCQRKFLLQRDHLVIEFCHGRSRLLRQQIHMNVVFSCLDDSVCNSACQSLSHCVFNHPTLRRRPNALTSRRCTYAQISDSAPTWIWSIMIMDKFSVNLRVAPLLWPNGYVHVPVLMQLHFLKSAHDQSQWRADGRSQSQKSLNLGL